MLKKSYIILSLIVLLFFCPKVSAATSSTQTTIGTQDGAHSYTITTQSYSSILPVDVSREFYENSQGTLIEEVNATYTITHNVYIRLTNGQYYNGYFKYHLATTPTRSEGTFSFTNQEVINTNDNGITIAPTGVLNPDIVVLFDNVVGDGGQVCIGQITRTYSYYVSNPNVSSLNADFPTTISISETGNFRQSTGVENNSLTASIYSAVEQSTYQDFDSIIALLTQIMNDDYTAFTNILTALNTSNNWLNQINTWTTNIYNKVNNIDTNVGTILTDLEAYITFMQTYIPYLQNISTNTLNTYNQLVTIYNYLVNRPTYKYTMYEGNIFLYSAGTKVDTGTGKYLIIKKTDNIEYIYINRTYITTNRSRIFYYDNYEINNTYNTPTRIYTIDNEGSNYLPIDFKYNENYCIINLFTQDEINSFRAYIGDGYTYSAIMYYIQMMEEMNSEESSIANEQNEQYATKENEAESVLAGAEVTLADLTNISFNINDHIDQNTKSTWFGFLSLIVNNNYITTLLLIAVTAIVAGYILYGKKS